jgi:hypothetical protein
LSNTYLNLNQNRLKFRDKSNQIKFHCFSSFFSFFPPQKLTPPPPPKPPCPLPRPKKVEGGGGPELRILARLCFGLQKTLVEESLWSNFAWKVVFKKKIFRPSYPAHTSPPCLGLQIRATE